jgi:hypothetical protein
VTSRRAAFSRWRKERPFWGAVLIALGGIEEFFSGQLDIGKIHIQLGLEGLQAMLIPSVLVLLAVLIALMPVHRIFYGVIALVLAIYSLIGVNLGGFVIGMLLATVGGVLAVAWVPPSTAAEAAGGLDPLDEQADADAGEPGEPGEGGPGGRGPKHTGAGVAVVAVLALALAAASPQQARAAAASAPASAPASSCVLGVVCLPSPSPSSTPSSTPSPSATGGYKLPDSGTVDPADNGDPGTYKLPDSGTVDADDSPSGGTIAAVPGQNRASAPAAGTPATTHVDAPSDATTETPLLALGADNAHGVFTLPSANATGSSLQIGGTSQIGVVTVPLADGTRATTIRIACDSLTIGDFHLDTKNRKEVVDLDTGGMTLSGHVVVWIDRVGAQYGNGEGLAQSLKANPLTLGALMTLLGQGHLVLGLVGAQADSLTYSDFHETASLQSTGF